MQFVSPCPCALACGQGKPKRKDIMESILINGVRYIKQPDIVVPQKPRRFYGSASLLVQESIDGFEDDPEVRLNRSDDERDNAHGVNHDDDWALPCYEQDLDYGDDRFPQYEPDQVFPKRKK